MASVPAAMRRVEHGQPDLARADLGRRLAEDLQVGPDQEGRGRRPATGDDEIGRGERAMAVLTMPKLTGGGSVRLWVPRGGTPAPDSRTRRSRSGRVWAGSKSIFRVPVRGRTARPARRGPTRSGGRSGGRVPGRRSRLRAAS